MKLLPFAIFKRIEPVDQNIRNSGSKFTHPHQHAATDRNCQCRLLRLLSLSVHASWNLPLREEGSQPLRPWHSQPLWFTLCTFSTLTVSMLFHSPCIKCTPSLHVQLLHHYSLTPQGPSPRDERRWPQAMCPSSGLRYM